jgi:hypothetical protein
LPHELGVIVSNERQPEFVMRTLHAGRKTDVAERLTPQAALVSERAHIRARQVG